MNVRNQMKSLMNFSLDTYRICRAKKVEVKKYKDFRRVEIMNKRLLSIEEKKQIDVFYISNYGKKIPYTWHQHYTSFTEKFDVKYFPELLFIPEFERYMNPYSGYAKVFSDKNILPYIATAANVRMPETIVSCVFGLFRDQLNQTISKENAIELLFERQNLFAKPSIDSSSGDRCMVLDFLNGIDLSTGKKVDEIIEALGDSFVIQRRIQCHDSISKIHSSSVNTFRIMTYRWREEIKHLPIIMRIGKGGSKVDNAHAGGIFVAIDDDGTMHEWAVTEFNDKYSEHPDTHIVFKNHTIPMVKDIIASANNMHATIPQLGAINWDFTINKDGQPVLIEANINGGSIWLFELAHGCGAFKEDTAEVLLWMKKMRKLKPKDREKHYFGK